ncbi:MAG: acyl carrier protein [Oscillospiraceae bacterium]
MIFEKIKKIICEQFDVDPEKITGETSFLDDLDADSLDVVELAMSMESEFDIPEMGEEDIKKIQTVEDLVNYVSAALGE